MARARILLADDHELFREGLAGMINSQPDLEVVGQAGDGLEALTLARDLRPDLIIMDIKMPLSDGVEATRLLRAQWPAARVLMLTVHDEDAHLFEAIEAGACGYLLKSMNTASFLAGVRSALAGDAALPPRLAARLLNEFAHRAQEAASRPSAAAPGSANLDAADLTVREQQVLSLIATGATDKRIAEQLAVSVHTVKSHVRSILGKLHTANRRQAARLATREGQARH